MSLAWLPTPWTTGAEEATVPKRNKTRLEYANLDLEEKVRQASDWKESMLLGQIHVLKRRLGEADGDLQIGGARQQLY